MLSQCRSPLVTEYYGAFLEPNTTKLWIVMELLASSVSDLVRSCCCSVVYAQPGKTVDFRPTTLHVAAAVCAHERSQPAG